MTYTLPLELILVIIASIDQDEDQNSLASFSQTSSAFLEPCQRMFFSHLHIGTSYTGEKTKRGKPGKRLLELLSSSPNIIPYVKRITLSDCGDPARASWLRKDWKLVAALAKLDLKKIEGFRLKRHYRATWERLSQPVRGVIVEICRSPVLVDLLLWKAPIALLSVCGPSLKHLVAVDCVMGVPDIPPVRRPTEITLESLQLFHFFNLTAIVKYITEPSTQVRVDGLRNLHITASVADDHTQISRLLEQSQHSLERLGLVPCVDTLTDLARHALHIPTCPKLAVLYIEVDATTPNTSGNTICTAWAAKTLATIPQPNVIDTIRLKLNFHLSGVSGGLTGEPGLSISSSLQSISEFVLKPGRLPKLKALRVEIYSGLHHDDAEAVRIWVLNALSIPPERGILHLRVFARPIN